MQRSRTGSRKRISPASDCAHRPGRRTRGTQHPAGRTGPTCPSGIKEAGGFSRQRSHDNQPLPRHRRSRPAGRIFSDAPRGTAVSHQPGSGGAAQDLDALFDPRRKPTAVSRWAGCPFRGRCGTLLTSRDELFPQFTSGTGRFGLSHSYCAGYLGAYRGPRSDGRGGQTLSARLAHDLSTNLRPTTGPCRLPPPAPCSAPSQARDLIAAGCGNSPLCRGACLPECIGQPWSQCGPPCRRVRSSSN